MLPVLALVLVVVPYVSRVMRASTIEVLESDYVEMARLKGMPERTVLWRHAVPNAIGPTLQVIAFNVAYLAAGIILLENIFNYPGIGVALREAVRDTNVPVVQFSPCSSLGSGWSSTCSPTSGRSSSPRD